MQMWHLLLFDREVFKKPEPSHRLVQSPLVVAEDLAACSTTVPVQMWQERVQSWCRCGWAEPTPGADAAGVSPSPIADAAGVGPVPVQMWPG